MSNLKFRVWNKELKQFISADKTNGLCLKSDGKLYYILSHATNVYPKECGENWAPLQFTGLKDMEGKEIYEGDILAHENRKIYYHVENLIDFIISANADEGFMYVDSEWKIIGNRFENSELLDKSK